MLNDVLFLVDESEFERYWLDLTSLENYVNAHSLRSLG